MDSISPDAEAFYRVIKGISERNPNSRDVYLTALDQIRAPELASLFLEGYMNALEVEQPEVDDHIGKFAASIHGSFEYDYGTNDPRYTIWCQAIDSYRKQQHERTSNIPYVATTTTVPPIIPTTVPGVDR